MQQKRDRLLNRWQGLQGALQAYRERLAGALEVHGLTRDVDDTRARIHEKAVTMSSQDLGRDLAAVEHLQRRQEAVQRDMTAIEGKLKVKFSETYTTHCCVLTLCYSYFHFHLFGKDVFCLVCDCRIFYIQIFPFLQQKLKII